MKITSKKLETEGNEDRKSFYMEFWRNKFMSNNSQKRNKNNQIYTKKFIQAGRINKVRRKRISINNY